jgi:hypothetical protein
LTTSVSSGSQVTNTTTFEDVIGSVSPGTLYAKWVARQEKKKAPKALDDEDELEYYL